MIDFSTWFSDGCYGGLACCMLAIAVNVLYTALRKRGTTRQLALAIVSSVISALLLLPALLWYNLRFSSEQAALSSLEIGLLLVYVALCGWILPCGVMTTYCLFTSTRDSNTAGRLPGQRKRTTRTRTAAVAIHPPRRQPGVAAPFVYDSDKAWGWLVHRNGKFVGQELELKRSIVSVGREEDNEVWLDDDTISRYHAELAWDKGQVYITDNDSLNGVLLNGRRIRSSMQVQHEDELEIGGHRFVLKCAQLPGATDDLEDPLLPQLRRFAQARNAASNASPRGAAGERAPAKPTVALDTKRELETSEREERLARQDTDIAGLETIELVKKAPAEKAIGLCIIHSGEKAGQSFLLDRPLLTVGRSSESDVMIVDASISRVHLQFTHQADGDYVRDLASRNGSQLNGLPLKAPRLLFAGDRITMGEIELEYAMLPEAQSTSILPVSALPPEPVPLKLPFPLRLPSKLKE
jgi:pSer/pThr/pTyr-binding forkhead associated (FHA) protein